MKRFLERGRKIIDVYRFSHTRSSGPIEEADGGAIVGVVSPRRCNGSRDDARASTLFDRGLFVEGEVLPESLNTFLTSVVGAEGPRGGADGSVLSGFVDGVKVHVVAYPYPWLEPITLCDGIRLCELQDIAAMKVSAIGQRESKKVFLDLAELLAIFYALEIMTFLKRNTR